MITVFDDVQRLHEPPGFVVSGKLQPSPERPERIDILFDAIRQIGGPIVAPPPLDDAVLATVHDRRSLAFLEGVWILWTRVRNAADYPAPNVHALGRATLLPAGYPRLGQMIAELGVPALVIQEGGYPSPSLGAHLVSLFEGIGS